MTAKRRRLTPEDRRKHLLDIGEQMFVKQPYEDVRIEEVASRAGISRALMYHYFPTKRDFFVAIFRRSSDALLAKVDVDPTLPIDERIANGLDAHIDYFVENPHNAMAVNRGSLALDELVQGIIANELATVRRRMLDASGVRGHTRHVASVALQGWLAFVRAACTEWLQHRTVSRDELRALCLGALDGALGQGQSSKTRSRK